MATVRNKQTGQTLTIPDDQLYAMSSQWEVYTPPSTPPASTPPPAPTPPPASTGTSGNWSAVLYTSGIYIVVANGQVIESANSKAEAEQKASQRGNYRGFFSDANGYHTAADIVSALNRGSSTTPPAGAIPAKKEYYSIGNDFYEASTGRYISATEWQRDWAPAGAVKVATPQTSPPATPTDPPVNPNDPITPAPEEDTSSTEDNKIKIGSDRKVGVGDKVTLAGDGLILVKFSNDPTPDDGIDDTATIWEFNTQDKTYKRVLSPQGLLASMGITVPEGSTVQKEVAKIYGSELYDVDSGVLNDESSVFYGGTFLPKEYAIQDDGTVPDYSDYIKERGTDSSLKTIYGVQKADLDTEVSAGNMIGQFFTTAVRKGALSQETMNEYLLNPSADGQRVLSRYINAWLYGGYTLDDIFRDLKAKELYAAGDEKYKDYKAFDDGIRASEWKASSEGVKSLSDPALKAPAEMLGIDSSMLNLPIFQISGEAFKTLVPVIDWTSPEFREEAKQIEASWYDIMNQKAEAETDQAKAEADYQWEKFRKDMELRYGIELSNNAREAWSQIQSLFSGAKERGLSGSGIIGEAMDRYLTDVRRSDDVLREGRITEEENKLRSHLLTSGSPQEVAAKVSAMDAEDRANGVPESEFRSVKWGLRPDPNKTVEVKYPDGTSSVIPVTEYFSKENLKKMYPDMDDDEIRDFSNLMFDEGGNYRSNLYRNLYANKYDLNVEKRDYQIGQLKDKKLIEEEKAYSQFTGGNPFSSFVPGETDHSNTAEKAAEAAAAGAKNISENLSGGSPVTSASGYSYSPSAPSKYLIDPITKKFVNVGDDEYSATKSHYEDIKSRMDSGEEQRYEVDTKTGLLRLR